MTQTDATKTPAKGTNHAHGLSAPDRAYSELQNRVAVLEAGYTLLEKSLTAHLAQPVPAPPPPDPEPTGPVFFVAPNGFDTSDGSQERPWASIQRFMQSNPVPGSTLFLRGGAYAYTQGGRTSAGGSLVGTAERPIVIRNAPGEVVTFPDVPSPTIVLQGESNVRASYVELDGIGFPNVKVNDAAAIVIGGLHVTRYLTNHITIRNCSGSLWSGSRSVDHIIGLIAGCEDVTVEDSTFTGTAGQGDAIVIYDQPAPLRTTVRRSTFTDFTRLAIQVWDYAGANAVASLAVEGSTFRRNGTALDLRYHGPASVKDCTFDVPAGPKAIYDPNHASRTVLSGNRYSA